MISKYYNYCASSQGRNEAISQYMMLKRLFSSFKKIDEKVVSHEHVNNVLLGEFMFNLDEVLGVEDNDKTL